uniref:Uncharacterized protein n=1 Tax=Ixodes ricinus TaxID=34613 RepID=A0A6B0U828_IXORI
MQESKCRGIAAVYHSLFEYILEWRERHEPWQTSALLLRWKPNEKGNSSEIGISFLNETRKQHHRRARPVDAPIYGLPGTNHRDSGSSFLQNEVATRLQLRASR